MFLNNETNILVIIFILILVIIAIIIKYITKNKEYKNLSIKFINQSKEYKNLATKFDTEVSEFEKFKIKFKDIIFIEEELLLRQTELDNKEKSIDELQNIYSGKEKTLNEEYLEKKKIFDSLLEELQVLEEDLELKSFGVYSPHYEFDTSEKYKAKLEEVILKQKDIIKNKQATICITEWRVNGSKVEGRKQTNQYSKLMLRAFNGECDATILKVRWNNVVKMEERIRKSFEIINNMGTVHSIKISNNYLDSKIDEFRLAYEYQEKKQEEKEEARQRREAMKEEELVQKEIDEVLKQADKEEMIYQDALEKAKKEISYAKEEEIIKLNEKIEELNKKLQEVGEMRKRAISRAQLTKSGYVYVISNIGSFGENVYKIGMTRRLEPLDRVRELGDASVPFRFDVHALIYSENAPELENNLHKAFDIKRVNMVNNRKEFYNISLEEIEKIVKESNFDIEFIKLAEAREYRETTAIINKSEQIAEIQKKYEFPNSLLN